MYFQKYKLTLKRIPKNDQNPAKQTIWPDFFDSTAGEKIKCRSLQQKNKNPNLDTLSIKIRVPIWWTWWDSNP